MWITLYHDHQNTRIRHRMRNDLENERSYSPERRRTGPELSKWPGCSGTEHVCGERVPPKHDCDSPLKGRGSRDESLPERTRPPVPSRVDEPRPSSPTTGSAGTRRPGRSVPQPGAAFHGRRGRRRESGLPLSNGNQLTRNRERKHAHCISFPIIPYGKRRVPVR